MLNVPIPVRQYKVALEVILNYLIFGIVLLVLFGAATFGVAQDATTSVVSMKSNHDFDTTVERLTAAIEESPLTLMTTIDHAANAAKNDLELRPTTLFLFGNPKVGTPLMQEAQSIALDLPQKMLVWQDEAGDVHVGFNNPFYLKARHEVEGQAERFTTINNVLTNLAKGVTE